MLDKYDKLGHIFIEIKQKVDAPGSDTGFSRYNTTEELIDDLERYIERLAKKDETVLKEILLFIAPTGDLQEVSMASGWGYDFIQISTVIERLIKEK